ncbi:MAG: hypothetical protein AAGA37_09225 [Actinomycetota bacterium]
MIIRPMLDDWEVPAIQSIRAVESRRIARLPVPGLDGDLQQDLGRASLAVEIIGSLHGDNARDTFLEDLQQRFRAGTPVTFVADITTATELEEVVIEHFSVEEVNDGADGFRYHVVIREYVEPPPPPGLLDSLDGDFLDDIAGLADLALAGLELPNLLGSVPSLGDPVAPILPVLDGVEAAVSAVPEGLNAVAEVLGV